MVTVRSCRPEEVAVIIATAGHSAMGQLVRRDLPDGSPEAVASAMRKMYEDVLRAPLAALLVAEGTRHSAAGQGAMAGHTLLLPQANGFTQAPELVVMDIFTQPAWRGMGVGKALLAQAEAYGRSIGCQSVAAQVALHNQPSLRLFTSMGFALERVVLGKRL